MRCANVVVLGVLLGAAGCAGPANSVSYVVSAPPAAAEGADKREAAQLRLDQLPDRPVLRPPATRPAGEAPVEALVLYAQARDAMAVSNRLRAAELLDQALKLDPDSYDLNYSLGTALVGTARHERGMKLLERAAALRPTSLEARLALGKQYLSVQPPNVGAALAHLRAALICPDYRTDAARAALTEYWLAKGLEQRGYTAAAIEVYQSLFRRFEHPRMLRGSTELYYQFAHRDDLYAHVGQLAESIGRHEDALKSFARAVATSPDEFAYHGQLVRSLLRLGRGDEARKVAAELVERFRASADAVRLLQDVYQRLGKANELIPALQRIMAANPDDRLLPLGLADALSAAGRGEEAEQLLLAVVKQGRVELAVLGRLADIYRGRGESERAAQLLMETTARQPELVQEVAPQWQHLIAAGARNRLLLTDLYRLEVEPAAEGAKLYWMARVADLWGRSTLARIYLERAALRKPAFAPALRLLANVYLARPDWAAARRVAEVGKLIEEAQKLPAGGAALAAEIRGVLLMHQRKFGDAEAALREAMELGRRGPEVQLALAAALGEGDKATQAEQRLVALVYNHPGFDDGHLALFRHYYARGAASQAVTVLRQWLERERGNVRARLLEASLYVQINDLPKARGVLLGLFKDEPQNTEVVAALRSCLVRLKKVDEYVKLFEEEREARPHNRAVVTALVEYYLLLGRVADGTRAVDAMRQSVGRDAELLYPVASLYERLGQRGMTEEVLRDVLRIDPRYAGANNDLGYMWTEAGRKLEEAEAMIRLATEVEPDNASFLDSLGWVLYKRGKFAEALGALNGAAALAGREDPVTLDHLGDVLYRLQRADEAAAHWQLAADRLKAAADDGTREELKHLQLQLIDKLKQHGAGRPVNVAPVATSPEKSSIGMRRE